MLWKVCLICHAPRVLGEGKDNDFLSSLGRRIRELRKDANLTQMQLADRAELHRNFIADVERGKRNLSAKNLNKLAQAPSCSAYQFIRRP